MGEGRTDGKEMKGIANDGKKEVAFDSCASGASGDGKRRRDAGLMRPEKKGREAAHDERHPECRRKRV